MTRPTVVVLCVHGEAKPHWEPFTDHLFDYPKCPGGRVLNQAIIIERDTDGKWPEWARHAVTNGEWVDEPEDDEFNAYWNRESIRRLDALASAQEQQSGYALPVDFDPPGGWDEEKR